MLKNRPKEQGNIAFFLLILIGVWLLLFQASFVMFFFGTVVVTTLLFIIPDMYVNEHAKVLKQLCIRLLPEFFDQLSLHVEHFSSMQEAVEHLPQSLSEPFATLLQKFVSVRKFDNSEFFFTKLSTSFDHQLMSEFASLAITQQKTGGHLEKKIQSLSTQAHREITLNAKKSGNITSGILLGPLLIFHVPALIILLMIPMIISFTQSL